MENPMATKSNKTTPSHPTTVTTAPDPLAGWQQKLDDALATIATAEHAVQVAQTDAAAAVLASRDTQTLITESVLLRTDPAVQATAERATAAKNRLTHARLALQEAEHRRDAVLEHQRRAIGRQRDMAPAAEITARDPALATALAQAQADMSEMPRPGENKFQREERISRARRTYRQLQAQVRSTEPTAERIGE